MADRYEALEIFIHERIEAALNDTRPEAYEDLMPVLETSGSRLKKYFVRVLLEQFDRAASSELKAHNIPHKLAQLETAEERARTRRRKWLENPSGVSRNERPVILPRLSTRDLVDCQLRDAREKWLADLNKRLSEAQVAAAESRARVDAKTDTVTKQLTKIEERLGELESVHHAIYTVPPE